MAAPLCGSDQRRLARSHSAASPTSRLYLSWSLWSGMPRWKQMSVVGVSVAHEWWSLANSKLLTGARLRLASREYKAIKIPRVDGEKRVEMRGEAAVESRCFVSANAAIAVGPDDFLAAGRNQSWHSWRVTNRQASVIAGWMMTSWPTRNVGGSWTWGRFGDEAITEFTNKKRRMWVLCAMLKKWEDCLFATLPNWNYLRRYGNMPARSWF